MFEKKLTFCHRSAKLAVTQKITRTPFIHKVFSKMSQLRLSQLWQPSVTNFKNSKNNCRTILNAGITSNFRDFVLNCVRIIHNLQIPCVPNECWRTTSQTITQTSDCLIICNHVENNWFFYANMIWLLTERMAGTADTRNLIPCAN